MEERKVFWIGNGRTVFPDRVVKDGSVLVEDGKIRAVNEPCPEHVEKVDAEGGYILPGFIDLHVHGGGGADFMDAEPDSFATVARAHCRHGTTALCPTTMTCGDSHLEKVIGCYLDAAKRPTGGAELLGLHLEGPFFSTAGRGAQPVGEQRTPTREMLERILRLGEEKIVRWDEAPELPGTDVFAAVMREHGVMASIAHTAGMARECYAALERGFTHVTHFLCATNWSKKIDGWTYGGMNEAILLRDDVTVEVICDGRHIPKELLLLAYKMKGAGRMALITDAMRAAGTQATTSILGGKQDGVPVLIKDGVAQVMDLSVFAGSIGTMDRAFRVAHQDFEISLIDTSCMLSATPAKIIGCYDRKGSLTVGKDADIVLMDPDFNVRSVYTCGRRFTDDEP